jgi:CHAD domain-containing protein
MPRSRSRGFATVPRGSRVPSARRWRRCEHACARGAGRSLPTPRTACKQQFAKIERKLRRRLTALQRDAGAHEAPFRAVAAATLVQHANELSARLATASTDPAELHATRIAAKRLRYLLEPAVPGLLDGNGMLDRLKTLQDLFGALTDAHELEVQLLEAGAAVVPALSLLHEESAALFGTLREEGTAAGPALKQQLEAAVRRLRPGVATPPSLRQRGRRPRGAAAVS